VGVVSQSQLSMFGFSKVAAPPPDRRYATATLPTLSRGRDEERSEAIQFVVRRMGRASAIPIASLPTALKGFATASTHPTGCIASGTRQLRTRHSGAR
jgi:hypothetical protein